MQKAAENTENLKAGTMFNRLLFPLFCLLLSSFTSPAQFSLNVTNYGAAGDAVQFYVNTVSNSSVVTTTSPLSGADIGKTIEIFGCGTQTFGINSYGGINGNQDLIATITNVVNGTNIYISFLPQVTTNNVFATYGTDNTPAFSNCIAACSGYTNAVINIPNGEYLLMPTWHTTDGYAYASVIIRRGGLHFVGESQTNTVLLSRGAWRLENFPPYGQVAVRGFLCEIVSPITNDYPFSIENLTLNGGVQQGNTIFQGETVNIVDGLGWDQQHSAYLTTDIAGYNSGGLTHQVLTNVTVQHWRGEMLKSIDSNTNGNIAIYDCTFFDGNATADNIFTTAIDCRYCTFNNLFQIAEVYQSYNISGTQYFMYNFATNITYNGFAWNGGLPWNPPFIMESNVFWFNGYGHNAIETEPGCNISILNNQIHCASYMTVFDIGAAGSQSLYPNAINSNITISGNSIYADANNSIYPGNTGIIGTFVSFGGPGITGIAGLTICSNTVTANTINSILYQGPNSTNVQFYNNTFNDSLAGFYMYNGEPMVLIQTNNIYTPFVTDAPQSSNLISYASGPICLTPYVQTGAIFILQDTIASQIPSGAYLRFDNSINSQGAYYTVYLSQSSSNHVIVTNGEVFTAYWSQNGWSTNRPLITLLPPSDLHVSP